MIFVKDGKIFALRQAVFIMLPPELGGKTEREERRGAGRPPEIGFTKVIQLTPYQQILSDTGISEKTAHVWQQIARVTEDKEE